MFVLAILIATFGFVIFLLGILGLLQIQIIQVVTLLYWGFWASFLYLRKRSSLRLLMTERVGTPLSRVSKGFLLLLVAQAGVNLIGVLGPELAFDALWYHLTFPKLYLEAQQIVHIPGGLLYYSTMPKLTEMLYVVSLAFQGEILAKFVHFLFGILTCLSIYLLGRRFLTQTYALLAVVVFYSNLVVGWESITAYIDLSRTFFEIMTLWAVVLFLDTKKRRDLFIVGIMLGIAVSTKLLALGSLVLVLILLVGYMWSEKCTFREIANAVIVTSGLCLFVALPWFLFSFLATGNPVYPFFTSLYDTSISSVLWSPLVVIQSVWEVLLLAADPVNPLYLLVFPLVPFVFRKLPREARIICVYSVLALLIWYVTPRTGGGRFILPYVPAFSLLAAATIMALRNTEMHYRKILTTFLITVVIGISVVSIVYRGAANIRYLPVIVGEQSRPEFLTQHLNFLYGDFYDTDGYFARTLKPGDRVLLYGFHNLYYVSFPFVHASWVEKGDTFTYIAVQNGELPQRFWYWPQIHYNPDTQVTVYSLGGQPWVY